MPFEPGLLDVDKFLVHTGILAFTNPDLHGNTVATSLATISCFVYQEREDQIIGAPNQTFPNKQFCIFPTTPEPSRDDHLLVVVDARGELVVAGGRITDVTDYNHWRYGLRFRRVEFERDTGVTTLSLAGL